MDFKIKISCGKCKCSCELRPMEFKNRNAFECPNCGQALPESVYEDLKTGVSALGKVDEYMGENANALFGYDFHLEVKSYNVLSRD